MSGAGELRKRALAGSAVKAATAGPVSTGPDSSDGKRKLGAVAHGAGASAWPSWLRDGEWVWALGVLLICGLTRFWRLDQPNGVVFDETHFGRRVARNDRAVCLYA